MRVESGGSQLVRLLGRGEPNASQATNGADITRLLNKQQSARQGIVEGKAAGQYRAIYDQKVRTVEEDVYEARDVVTQEDVFAERAITGTRDVTESRDIFETRNITETRNVYETQAVFEDRALYATKVDGTRNLAAYKTLAEAGIDVGSDLSIKVGNNQAAVIKLESTTRIAVTQNGTTQRFNFTSAAGSFTGALVSALDSVQGLGVTLSSGKLKLETDNAQSLTIADVANGLLDFSSSPLAKLGLTAGTTNASISGYERVQTGTRQVLVGTQQVVIGTEQVLIGSQQVVIGQETITLGKERYKAGERQVVTGSEIVKTGTATRSFVDGTTIVGLEKTDEFGVGDVKALAAATLPAGYIDALFGLFDPAGDESEKTIWADVKTAYETAAETKKTGSRTPADNGFA